MLLRPVRHQARGRGEGQLHGRRNHERGRRAVLRQRHGGRHRHGRIQSGPLDPEAHDHDQETDPVLSS